MFVLVQRRSSWPKNERRTKKEDILSKVKIKMTILLLYNYISFKCFNFWFDLTARRRADIKRKKLKTLGKSKSTESEEECEEEEADEGR